MQEKKGEMVSNGNSKDKIPKKANLMDPHSIKHLLDKSITEIVASLEHVEDVRMSNIRLFMGAIIIIISLVAHFYLKKFPVNKNFLIRCIKLYIVLNGLLQLIIFTKEKNVILFTYPPPSSFNSTGLIVSSKLPRFSDMYTWLIASADPKSVSTKKPVEFKKSVTQGNVISCS
ncbi:probable signal peptidase complex subunit 2 [Macadamia integrifolia]|uniref:probable signal peptidase complex subunit 2 n=1 Tax=Macadamia integrifolia TaxID=60698 RepID=UPI001C4EC977|nr:probable signal peptidase complex subunit 2 [Macadamia integrifolia]